MTTAGVVLLLVGAGLMGATLAASGAGASGQSLTVTPHAHLTAASQVVVAGAGFAHGSNGILLECNPTVGEPATVASIAGSPHLIPVGCTSPVPATTTRFGRLSAKTLGVVVGTLGTWETGTDTTGLPAAADSAAYPCPPTASQEAVGISCVYEFLDNKGQLGSRSVSFKTSGGGGKPTTTTTATTSTTISTTTTMPGCDPRSVTATATPPDGTATVTVSPGTCLVNGTDLSLTATGLVPQSTTNFLGTILECNSDPSQPTVSVLGTALPVSCTGALSHTFTPDSGGTMNAVVTAVDGVTGPPAQGTDSAGNPATQDAADYPCPPTAAQVAAGDTCVIVVGDSGGDQVVVPISFAPTPTSGRRGS